jgi:hypothetical protein
MNLLCNDDGCVFDDDVVVEEVGSCVWVCAANEWRNITILLDRSTCASGSVTGRKSNTAASDDIMDERCVFVLSPALMEILEFKVKGEDGGFIASSRHNPYRKAVFQCFALLKEVSDLLSLATIAVDTAVSVFG